MSNLVSNMANDPSIPDDDERFQALLADCLEQLQRGETIDRAKLRRENPTYADSVCEFLDNQQAFRSAVAKIRAGDEDGSHIDSQFAPTLGSRVPPGSHSFKFGDQLKYIGEYEILGEVARGGMGIVFKAHQEKLRRTVALKMILAGRLARKDDVVRFHRESRAAAALNHANIVAVHEVGQHQGHHYFTMDFVEGESLATMLARGSLAPRRAAELIKTVAEAIQHAHAQGVVHRDLKPANILVDIGGTPHVTDFGLAKTLAEVNEPDAELTATGQIIGTPSYMSPEQAAGKHPLVGVATDVYSLGAILYACLSGRAPFVADSTIDTLHQVINKEPVSLRLLNSKVPQDLETVCLKCLRKEPHSRYLTAEQLAEDLGRFLDGRPVEAKPTGLHIHAWKWCKRRPEIAALLTMLGSVLLIGLLAVGFWWREAEIAGQTAKQNLYASLIREAEARRTARQSGYRSTVWSILKDASQLSDVATDPYLIRQEAVACLGDFVGLRPITIEGPLLLNSNDCAVFLDEHRIAVALGDGDVSIRDLTTGNENSHIFRSGGAGRGLATTGEGHSLIIADRDHLQRWDQRPNSAWIQKWEVPARFHSLFMDLCLSEDWIAVIDQFQIRIVRLDDGQTEQTLNPPRDYEFLHKKMGFLTVAISPDGKQVAAADSPKSVFIWDAKSGELIKRIRAPTTGIPDLEFTSDGRYLVLGSDQGVVTYECPSFSQWSIFRTDAVRSAASSPDGRQLLVQTESGSVQLWNLTTQRLLAELSHPGTALSYGSTAFSPNGNRMLSAGSNRIRVWKPDGTSEKAVLAGHSQAVHGVAFHPSAPILASGSHDGTLTFWDSRSGEAIKTIELDEQIQAIAYSPSGSQLAVATTESFVVWNVNGAERSVAAYHKLGHKAFEDVSFSPDGKWVATCGNFGTYVWQIVPGKADQTPQYILKVEQSLFGKSITFDSTSSYVAVNALRHFGWFNLETASHEKSVISKQVFTSNLASSQSAATIFGITTDGSIQAWDLNAQLPSTRMSELQPLSSSNLAISPSGMLAAAQTSPVNVGLFDVIKQQPLFRLAQERAAVTSLAWEQSGRRLAVGLADGSIAIWDIAQVAGQLYQAGLAGDLQLFREELPSFFDSDPIKYYQQTWQEVDQYVRAEQRARQILADWNIGSAEYDRTTPETQSSTLPDSIRLKLETWSGSASPTGAFALAMPIEEFDALTTDLAAQGYRAQSIRPYWHGQSLLVAASWQSSELKSRYELSMTSTEIRVQQKIMLDAGYQLVDLGGYFPTQEKEESAVRYYAVWQLGSSAAGDQLITLGVDSKAADTNFNRLHNEWEPVLRHLFFTNDGQHRISEVWERFDQPMLDYWVCFFGDRKSIGQKNRELIDCPVRYFHVSHSSSGAETMYSGVWRSDAKPLQTHILAHESPEVIRLVGVEMLRQGYVPRSVCVAATENAKPIAAAIWDAANSITVSPKE